MQVGHSSKVYRRFQVAIHAENSLFGHIDSSPAQQRHASTPTFCAAYTFIIAQAVLSIVEIDTNAAPQGFSKQTLQRVPAVLSTYTLPRQLLHMQLQSTEDQQQQSLTAKYRRHTCQWLQSSEGTCSSRLHHTKQVMIHVAWHNAGAHKYSICHPDCHMYCQLERT